MQASYAQLFSDKCLEVEIAQQLYALLLAPRQQLALEKPLVVRHIDDVLPALGFEELAHGLDHRLPLRLLLLRLGRVGGCQLEERLVRWVALREQAQQQLARTLPTCSVG